MRGLEGIEETPREGYDYNSGAQDPNASEDKFKYYGGWWGGFMDGGYRGGLLKVAWATWDMEKYNMMKKTLWTDSKNNKFVGLDHQIKLGTKGETVTEYYK